LTLKMKAPQSFEISATFHQPTRRQIPEELESLNLLASELFFLILAHPIYKM